MTTPTPPEGVRIAHPDGTSTPFELAYVGTEPRQVNGDIYIVDIWEATTVVEWNAGDKLAIDREPDGCFTIRMDRVGMR
jgi:hypothetical protein